MQSLMMWMQLGGLSANANLWVFAGIAIAACVLGVEIACIGILIRKYRQAKHSKRMKEEQERAERYSGYGMLALGMAAPFSAEMLLLILAGLAALAAVVLLAMVLIFRALGYDFVSSELLRELANRNERDGAYEPVPEDTNTAAAQVPVEEPAEALGVVAEEETEALTAEVAEQAEDEAIEAETAPSEEPVEVAVGEVLDAPAEAAASVEPIAAPAPIEGAAQGSATPTRIVQIEKQYTETVKEVQQPAPAAQVDPATGILIEKLSTLIDKMDQQQENAQATHPAEDGAAVAASAAVSAEDDEDDDEEEDDDFDGDEDGAEATDRKNTDDDEDAEDPERFTGNERIIGFDEQTGCYIVAHYRKSFTAKLIQSRPHIKQYYSELKNALLAYKGTKSRISWTADSFHNGRAAIAKINVKTRSLEIYLALDPASLDGTVYRGRDVGHLKKYADTPFQYKLRTPRKFKWAMELVQRVCEEQGLSPIDAEKVDYESQYPFEDTDSLVARGLIKEYIREENPASTFELDENHVSAVPSVDETVIPANANFSWEFDNEVLSQKEPEPVAEEPAPAAEVEAEAAPVQEAPAAPTGTVIRETTKTTTMRYTEQYYGDSNAPTAYKEYMTDDPFAVGDAAFAAPAEAAQDKPVEETDANEPTEEALDGAAEPATVAEDAYGEEAYAEDAVTEADAEANAEANAEAYAEESVEETDEAGLLSTFDETQAPEEDADLDWGIPAGLTVRTTIYTEEAVTVEETAEAEESEEAPWAETEADAPVAENDEGEYFEEATEEDTEGAYYEESAEEYAEGDYYEENTEEYAEGDYYEENTEEYAEDDYYEENAEEYAEGDYYAENTEEYAEGDYYEENAEGDYYEENTEEYAEGDYYEENTEEDTEGDYYEESTEEYAEEEAVAAPDYRPQVNPDVALVDVSVLEENFPTGSEIDLEILKARGLVLPSAKVLKISAAGALTKSFTVIADQFTMSAIIAINTTGGDAQQIIKR